MAPSKKRIQLRAGSAPPDQKVPAALREWVHIWHGVRVHSSSASGQRESIFHSGSRLETLPFWKRVIRLPSNSLFASVDTVRNPRRAYKDFLYVLLNMRWVTLMTVLLGTFLFNIVLFAIAVFYGCGDPSSMLTAFNLSYQTFSTIGFGIVYPTTTCSNLVMVVESFASMLITSAITGLVFAKFAKPKAKVAFSKVCVIQPYGKQYLALVVRVANATQSKDVTHDVIMETNFKLNLLRIECKPNDEQWRQHQRTRQQQQQQQRQHYQPPQPHAQSAPESQSEPQAANPDTNQVLCSYNLKLQQNNFITFRMGIAVVHLIDESSPLFGIGYDALSRSDMLLEVAMSGVDSTLQDTVSERYTYSTADFRWGYRFAELLEFHESESQVVMDFAKLSTVESAPIDERQYIRSVSIEAPTAQPSTAAPLPGNGLDVDETKGSESGINDGSGQLPEWNDRGLYAINELSPDDLPETRMFRRSSSSMSDLGATGLSISSSSRPQRGVLSRQLSMGMEPLFEPLLQSSVGVQRGADGVVNNNGSEESRGGGGRQTVLAKLRRLIRKDSSDRVESQLNDVDMDDEGCEEPVPTEFAVPILQQRQLQDQLAGDMAPENGDGADLTAEFDGDDPHNAEHGDSTIESTGGHTRPAQNSSVNSVAMDETSRTVSRPSLARRSRTRNQSMASIDVEDTPRFLNIAPINIPKSYDFMRLYYSALYVGWPKIVLVFVLAFIVINLTFGLLYWFDMSGIEAYANVDVSSYELAFFMSVHTLATIGYGSISPFPSSVYMNLWVLVEAALGIIAVTIITGIAWSKFARPRAHIHFSSRIAITTIYGHRCLVFRAANTRHSGDVHENFFRIGVIQTNHKTGLRQLYDVPLVTAEWPSIKLPATLIHVIDHTSPFFRITTYDDVSTSRVAVIALLTGLDTTFSENVYARKMYFWDDFEFDMRFDDFADLRRDHVRVDFTKFDQLVPEMPAYAFEHGSDQEHNHAYGYV